MQPGTYPEASGLQVGTRSQNSADDLRDDEFADNFITPDVPAASPVASRPSLPGPMPLGVGRPIQTAGNAELGRALTQAERRGRYMVVVFSIEPSAAPEEMDRIEYFRFTSAGFPKGDFTECVGMLERDLVKQLDKKE